ncbi:hypothetical protein EDD16DRAFT_1132493 [Pisolithus croceorrhizus]|nr:hypothetical protein EDD16DRAFT_1132493 [Pisolithus croceorrhizus]
MTPPSLSTFVAEGIVLTLAFSKPSISDTTVQSEIPLTSKPSARICKLTPYSGLCIHAFFFFVSIHIAAYILLPAQASSLTCLQATSICTRSVLLRLSR